MRKLRKTGIIMMMVLSILCLSACQETTEAKYDRAQKLLEEERYFEAGNVFEEISTYEDSSKMAMYTKAIAAAENGEYDAGISNFKSLGDFRDSSMMITYYTGRQYESRASTENWSIWITAAEYYDMVSYFLDSRTRAENCRKAVYDEAVRLAGNGEFKQSIEMLNALAPYSDCDKLSRYYAAFKLEQEEKYAEASAAFVELGEYRNSAEQAILALQRGYDKGDVLEKAGKQEEACAVFASLGDYEDAFDRANKPYYEQGIAKREEKDWYAAIQAFEKAGTYSDAETQIFETRYQQAKYKREQQNWDEAVTLFTELGEYKDSALQVNETYYCHASVLEENGDLEGAYDLFISLGRYRDAYERANQPYYDLGIAKRNAQEWDEAIAAFTKVIKYNDAANQISETYYQQASALETAGDQEGAYEIFMNLGEYRDSFERACKPYYELGVEKREAGAWTEAVAAFARAGNYSDAADQIKATYYAEGEAKRTEQDWNGSRTAFENAGEYKDAKEQIAVTWYEEGETKCTAQDWEGARMAFSNAGGYTDAAKQIAITWYVEGETKRAAQDWEGARAAFANAGAYVDATEQIAATWYAEGENKRIIQDWDGAIESYQAAGKYGESTYRIQECLYQKTVEMNEKSKSGVINKQEIIEAFLRIEDPELFRKARDILEDNNVFSESWNAELVIGNIICFGKYEQDNDSENGPENITWRVIHKEGNKALLLSEKILDAMPYMVDRCKADLDNMVDEEIWQKTYIYEWINSSFIPKFSEQEVSVLIPNETGDTFFLLDNKEYKTYCSSENGRSVEATAYAIEKDIMHHDLHYYFTDSSGNRTSGTAVMWWIRTGAIKEDSYIYPDDLSIIAGFRPAVWISCERGPTHEWIDKHYPIPQSKEKDQ